MGVEFPPLADWGAVGDAAGPGVWDSEETLKAIKISVGFRTSQRSLIRRRSAATFSPGEKDSRDDNF